MQTEIRDWVVLARNDRKKGVGGGAGRHLILQRTELVPRTGILVFKLISILLSFRTRRGRGRGARDGWVTCVLDSKLPSRCSCLVIRYNSRKFFFEYLIS